jgi:magnesium transporter
MASLRERLESEQISIFVGKNFVLTFQEREGDCFEPVRERIRAGRGRIRKEGPDYLTYAIIDAVVDNYFPILEHYGERIEGLEAEVITSTTDETIAKIHDIKRDLLSLRRAIWPKREALSALSREPQPVFSDETRVYLRDCYDHTVQLMDMVETYRELASGLMDVYLTSVSNRMNEVMKVLTIIATIFIPLGFVAGVYGMNFNQETSAFNMPELGWKYGYLYCLGLMAVIAAGLLVYFRRKGWLGPPGRK